MWTLILMLGQIGTKTPGTENIPRLAVVVYLEGDEAKDDFDANGKILEKPIHVRFLDEEGEDKTFSSYTRWSKLELIDVSGKNIDTFSNIRIGALLKISHKEENDWFNYKGVLVDSREDDDVAWKQAKYLYEITQGNQYAVFLLMKFLGIMG